MLRYEKRGEKMQKRRKIPVRWIEKERENQGESRRFKYLNNRFLLQLFFVYNLHMNFTDYLIFLIVALLWGFTNVLIKKFTLGIKYIKSESKWQLIYEELKYLLFNWKVNKIKLVIKNIEEFFKP